MSAKHPASSSSLPPVDWHNVRPIYKKLSDEFSVLTDPYKIVMTKEQKLKLDHLILSIDVVDQYIDEMPHKEERDLLTTSIKESLRQKGTIWSHPLASAKLEKNITILKQIVQDLGIQSRFAKAASRIFSYTEEKRHTPHRKALIQLVQKEGYATSELPLAVMQVSPDHPFAGFFSRLCMIMGIADLIVDARSDYRTKYIVARPSPLLYFHLVGIVLYEGLRLIWQFPYKISFLLYCIRFSFALLWDKD